MIVVLCWIVPHPPAAVRVTVSVPVREAVYVAVIVPDTPDEGLIVLPSADEMLQLPAPDTKIDKVIELFCWTETADGVRLALATETTETSATDSVLTPHVFAALPEYAVDDVVPTAVDPTAGSAEPMPSIATVAARSDASQTKVNDSPEQTTDFETVRRNVGGVQFMPPPLPGLTARLRLRNSGGIG